MQNDNDDEAYWSSRDYQRDQRIASNVKSGVALGAIGLALLGVHSCNEHDAAMYEANHVAYRDFHTLIDKYSPNGQGQVYPPPGLINKTNGRLTDLRNAEEVAKALDITLTGDPHQRLYSLPVRTKDGIDHMIVTRSTLAAAADVIDKGIPKPLQDKLATSPQQHLKRGYE
jgi:hypothetical protein